METRRRRGETWRTALIKTRGNDPTDRSSDAQEKASSRQRIWKTGSRVSVAERRVAAVRFVRVHFVEGGWELRDVPLETCEYFGAF